MSTIILHHYGTSPYSEKIRAVLGFKKLDWKSVTAAAIMPKPDLLPLTGGYRRIPVMQIGRDIYCDTRLIVQVLERLHPAPALIPGPLRASCAAFTFLEPTLFMAAVGTTLQPAGVQALIQGLGREAFERFIQDRTKLFSGGKTERPNSDLVSSHFPTLAGALDAQLAEHPFLLGSEPTLADFIAYHPIWFIGRNPGVASCLEPFKNIATWRARIKALGHGQPTELTAAEAMEIARTSQEGQPFEGAPLTLENLSLGQRVIVHASDYGIEPVEGTLVHASSIEVAIQRNDDRAGEVVVHFPRVDFKISAA